MSGKAKKMVKGESWLIRGKGKGRNGRDGGPVY